MIPRECRRLAEVDFPIAAVSAAAVLKEKRFPVPRGLPSTMHHWWARRPLASSRAMLMALLLPDPCDEHCPDDFRVAARRLLLDVPQPAPWHYTTKEGETPNEGLRRVLLGFIADFADWDNASDPEFLRAGRALVRAAHGDDASLVVDPFAGGGSIPLEALRLGCDAFASDLNPVACLLLRAMLEDIPCSQQGLAEEVRRAGGAIRAKLADELKSLYPADADGGRPVAYLWARTVRCEAPECGAEIPLLRSFWLSRKRGKWRALKPVVHRGPKGTPRIDFRIITPGAVDEVSPGTVSRARATCLACRTVLPPDRVRAQLAARRGGGDVVFDEDGHRTGGAMLTAVAVTRAGTKGRHFRLPTDADYAAVRQAHLRYSTIEAEWSSDPSGRVSPFPDEPLPPIGTLGFRVQRYGCIEWGDLFTRRQKVVLNALASEIAGHWRKGEKEASVLAIALNKVADFNCCSATWRSSNEDIGHLFGRQAVPLVWDFAETNPMESAYVGYERAVRHVSQVVGHIETTVHRRGAVQQADSAAYPLPDLSAAIWFTDPPYYDAVPYADLSDFFLVWLRRSLPGHPLLRDPFDADNRLSPKASEIVQDVTKAVGEEVKDAEWFEGRMATAFSEGRRVLQERGIGSVVFAHKTTDGWEALLSGMIRGGWTITASWPIGTEMRTRLRAMDSAALATSVHLVCRPRPEDAGVGDWEDIRRQLPTRVSDWMKHLQGEGIRGADLVFACIGPALEIFSRYRAVETVDGAEIKLREYLERVWDTVGQAALQRVLGDAGGTGADLEEDARLTALFLWTMQSSESEGSGAAENGADGSRRTAPGPYSLPFDVVRRFAQPMGIDLDAWTGRTIETEKGVVRLLPVARRSEQIFGGAAAEASEPWGDGEQVSEQLALDMDWHRKTEAADYRRNAPVLGPDARIRSEKATTLDRVHAAMLLQSGGRSQALRTLLTEETARGPEFLRLANALSALYPRGSEEKRLLDAMLLAVPR